MTYNITTQTQNQGKINKAVILVGCLLISTLLWSVSRLFFQYLNSRRLLQQEQAEKNQLLSEQQNLTYRTKRAQTDGYIEERARQLALSKEHELIVIAAYPSPTTVPTPIPAHIIPPYQAWLQVFSQP